jgi:hypothetical protein
MTFEYVTWGLVLSAWGILFTIVVPFIYVKYTIKSQYKENYNAALNKLLEEMENNYQKMHNFNSDLIAVSSKWRDKNDLTSAWLPKVPSFGRHRYILHYLPSKAYYNFLNRGFFLRLEEGRLEHLMGFYAHCIQFSEKTTPLEETINLLDKQNPNFESDLDKQIQHINTQYKMAVTGFDSHYGGENGFNPQNREGLEIRYWWNV